MLSSFSQWNGFSGELNELDCTIAFSDLLLSTFPRSLGIQLPFRSNGPNFEAMEDLLVGDDNILITWGLG